MRSGGSPAPTGPCERYRMSPRRGDSELRAAAAKTTGARLILRRSGLQKSFRRNGIKIGCHLVHTGYVPHYRYDFVLQSMVDSTLDVNVATFSAHFEARSSYIVRGK